MLIGETIRAEYRGRAVGSVQSGWAIGWGLAVLSQAVLFSLLPPETAWRWMFAVGALPALLVFYLRRYVEEPQVAAETRARAAAVRRPAADLGDLLGADPEDDAARLAGGGGLPGRLLRDHHLGAALPDHRAPPVDRVLHRLPRRR